MGGSKHLAEVEGVSMLARVIAALRDSSVERVGVVLRPGDAAGAELAARLDVAVCWAEPPEDGRAASVRAAVSGTDPAAAGLLVALADQPWLRGEDFDALIRAFAASRGGIVRARYAGQPGTPTLFARRHFDELRALAPGEGGRVVVARHAASVHEVDLDPARGRDVDRPEDLAREV